jgi:hypothetical protein
MLLFIINPNYTPTPQEPAFSPLPSDPGSILPTP